MAQSNDLVNISTAHRDHLWLEPLGVVFNGKYRLDIKLTTDIDGANSFSGGTLKIFPLKCSTNRHQFNMTFNNLPMFYKLRRCGIFLIKSKTNSPPIDRISHVGTQHVQRDRKWNDTNTVMQKPVKTVHKAYHAHYLTCHSMK